MLQYQTPMMQQYAAIKAQYPDCIIFFRLGDFYEMFESDATLGSQILGLTLTSRPEGKDGRVPMCGVPYHAYETYLTKLVQSGHKVALCEQIGPIPKSGLVQRHVTRIVTPGTLLDEKSLRQNMHNFLVAMHCDADDFVIAMIDISTGDCAYGKWPIIQLLPRMTTEIAKLNAPEYLLSSQLPQLSEIQKILKTAQTNHVSTVPDPQLIDQLLGLYLPSSPQDPLVRETLAVLLDYLKYTQQGHLQRLHEPKSLHDHDTLLLDRATIINLELFQTLRDQDKQGSLIAHLDQTCTPMGARLLRNWLSRPSRERTLIEHRQQCVEYWFIHPTALQALRTALKSLHDIERISARINSNLSQPRDLFTLRNSLETIFELIAQSQFQEYLTHAQSDLSSEHLQQLRKLIQYLDTTLNFAKFQEENILSLIHQGVHTELDQLLDLATNTLKSVQQIEQTEREQTGISTLRIKHNQVFGYYIEISKGQLSKVPPHFIRRQTLVNAERYITPELKTLEEQVYAARERIQELESQIYQEVLQTLSANSVLIHQFAQFISQLDCLATFAHLATIYNYHRPQLNAQGYYHIHQGRHPVVERLLDTGLYVPNDTSLGIPVWQAEQVSLHLLTGPNMAGKSVYMRQLALIVIMTHLGCFVPAEKANIALTDKLFVRSGAADSITAGLSTFMVEMTETANILEGATAQSLIIMDEIGRGTSTYDGIAIAWAIAEYLIQHTHAKTLFATHYHELQTLAQLYPQQIQNYHMAVDTHQGEPIFLHTLTPGPASHSYGIAVAKQAGLPQSVIHRAHELSHNLENTPLNEQKHHIPPQQPPDCDLLNKLSSINPNELSPLEALKLLFELKKDL